MAIQGQKREQRGEYQKVVGLFEARVIAFNPSREELEDILGVEIEKDPEYFVPDFELKDENGQVTEVVKKLTISAWIQQVVMEKNADGELVDTGTGPKFNVRFNLLDKNRRNRDNTKNQYMNQHGMASWGENQDSLLEWFREVGGLRIAKIGEENFYDFLRAWLLIDFRNDPNAELTLDWNRLMRNDLRELRDALNSDLAGTVLCMATVRTADGENGPVEYQSVYNGKFLPGSYIKAFRQRGRRAPKALEKYIKEITDIEYGCADFFVMEELRSYNPDENPTNTGSVHVPSGGSTVNSDDLSY